MTPTDPSDLYETSDLAFVAFARLRGAYEQTVVREGERVMFRFVDPVNALMRDYLQGGTVPARQFAEEMKTLKQLVHHVH